MYVSAFVYSLLLSTGLLSAYLCASPQLGNLYEMNAKIGVMHGLLNRWTDIFILPRPY